MVWFGAYQLRSGKAAFEHCELLCPRTTLIRPKVNAIRSRCLIFHMSKRRKLDARVLVIKKAIDHFEKMKGETSNFDSIYVNGTSRWHFGPSCQIEKGSEGARM